MHKKPVLALLLIVLAACTASTPPVREDPATADRMAAAHAHDAPLATPAATTPPVRETTVERVSYGEIAGQKLSGYLITPKGAKQGRTPGLLVIHEWWGLNDNVRDEARRLAAEGYVTLAVDLYGGRNTGQVQEALQLARSVGENPAAAEENLRQAYAYLRNTGKAPRIGSIGWCFGGRWSLRTALLFPKDLAATVIYYGTVTVPEEQLATLQMPILGLFGEKDRAIPVASVRAFQATLQKLGKNADIHIYEGADHAFANPSGTAYQAAAAEDAWRLTVEFLRRNLKPGQG